MDLLNLGRVNDSRSGEGSSEVLSTVRGVMIQKREALKSIRDEMERLVEEQRRIEEDLVRLSTTMAPHNHNLLPNELLSRIFILAAQDYGPMSFPSFGRIPPQVTVSHVCTYWRRVALRTSELWSNTQLLSRRLRVQDPDCMIRSHQRWVLRAAMLPVTLSMDFDYFSHLGADEFAVALRRIVLPLQIKTVHLKLHYEQFVALSTSLPSEVVNLLDLELDIGSHAGEVVNTSDPQNLITRIRSLTLHEPGLSGLLNQFLPSVPWSQLRYLDISTSIVDMHLICDVLRQAPKLQHLHWTITRSQIDQLSSFLEEGELIMPSLRNISLKVETTSGIELDKVLRRFVCYSLTELRLNSPTPCWTGETFMILKQQYNMQGIQKFVLYGSFALPISSILQDAPALDTLFLTAQDAVMDDRAIVGLSNGTFGRSLKTLALFLPCDPGEVLRMVEARKETADALIESGCNWREEITNLKYVRVYNTGHYHHEDDDENDYEERIAKLGEAGISFEMELEETS